MRKWLLNSVDLKRRWFFVSFALLMLISLYALPYLKFEKDVEEFPDGPSVTNFPVFPKGAKEVAEKKAFVTIVSEYKDKYGAWAMITAYWLRQFHPDIPRILMHIKELKMTQATRENLIQWGWEIREVEGIQPPYKITSRYHWLFTKLRLWQLVEFDRIIYLDVDVAITGSFDPLWSISPLQRPFAAVRDNWFGETTSGINAGMILLTPSLEVFHSLMEVCKDPYHIKNFAKLELAEQGFLNYYYGNRFFVLHDKFNLNIQVSKDCSRYFSILEDVRMVHMTSHKPGPDLEPRRIFCQWYKVSKEVMESKQFQKEIQRGGTNDTAPHRWIVATQTEKDKYLNCDDVTCKNLWKGAYPIHKKIEKMTSKIFRFMKGLIS